MMLCPRCKQGEVVKAIIIKTEDELYVCDECEATWFYKDDIGKDMCLDFGVYMESKGLAPLWSEITIEETN